MVAPSTSADHYRVARRVQQTLQRYRDLQDIIAILGTEQLYEEDKVILRRARKIERQLHRNLGLAGGDNPLLRGAVPGELD